MIPPQSFTVTYARQISFMDDFGDLEWLQVSVCVADVPRWFLEKTGYFATSQPSHDEAVLFGTLVANVPTYCLQACGYHCEMRSTGISAYQSHLSKNTLTALTLRSFNKFTAVDGRSAHLDWNNIVEIAILTSNLDYHASVNSEITINERESCYNVVEELYDINSCEIDVCWAAVTDRLTASVFVFLPKTMANSRW